LGLSSDGTLGRPTYRRSRQAKATESCRDTAGSTVGVREAADIEILKGMKQMPETKSKSRAAAKAKPRATPKQAATRKKAAATRKPRTSRGARNGRSPVRRTTELSEDVLKSLDAGAKSALEAVGKFVDTVEEALPRDGVGSSKRTEITDSAIEMAQRLVHTQYEFLRKVVDSAGKSLTRSNDAK
jgi:hypothetical protein